MKCKDVNEWVKER